VALNDLRIIAEITEHSTTFLHYLVRRIRCNSWKQLEAADELDFFAHYMQSGLYFDNDERFHNTDLVTLASHTDDLDHYYAFREGLRSEVSKPRIAMHPNFERLITKLETAQPKHFASACLALLDFDDPTRTKIAAEIDQIDAAEEMGRSRIITLPFEGRDDALILGGARINTPDENHILLHCRTILETHRLRSAIAVLWQAPLTTGNIKVFRVQQQP